MTVRYSVLTLIITATSVAAQPGQRPQVLEAFPQFGGVNGDHLYRSRVALHATQLTNELNTIKTLLAGPRVPAVYKPSLNALAVAAVQQGENLRTLATKNATRAQILAADGPLDAATQTLTAQASRVTQFAPGLAESLQRLEHTEQQLHAAIHQGGGGGGGVIPPPNPDVQLQRVRRMANTLENQTETLRNLADSVNDGSAAGRALELAARSMSFKASRFDRTADNVNAVIQLRDDFSNLLVQWRALETTMRQIRVGREFRLQATHVESTLRLIGEQIPNNVPWDYGGGFVPPPGPGPGPGPVVPPIGPGIGFLNRGALVIGAGEGGGPRVRLFTDLSGEAIYDFFAYDMTFLGGVRVAVADLTGDNIPDLVVGPGPGMPPLVRVFDGRNMRLLSEFYAFDVNWLGGVFVAAADRTRDGKSWIAVSADNGGVPQVKVIDLAMGKEIDSFMAYDERFRGGCRVALGDVNGDGTPDLVTVPGPGLEPRVKVFDGRNRAVMGDFLAFDRTFVSGLSVDTSDLTRNGRADIIVGTEAGGTAFVRIFDANNARKIGELSPFPRLFSGGVRVAAYDFDNDGTPDVVCSPGRDPNFLALPIKIYSGVNSRPLGEFFPFGNQFRGGGYVGSR